MPDDLIQPLAQFGVAGLMGVLWVWERTLSRTRETHLAEAHRRLMVQRQQLRVLVGLVRNNTRAIERFTQTQIHLQHLIERLQDDQRSDAA